MKFSLNDSEPKTNFLAERYRNDWFSADGEPVFHKPLYDSVRAQSIDERNLIINGPGGCGKKTFLRWLLRLYYGKEGTRLSAEEYTIKNYGSCNMKVTIMMNSQIIVFTPTGNAIDKYVIIQIIKKLCQQRNVFTLQRSPAQFRTIVIAPFDKMSRHAQTTFRRVIDNCTHNKFIFMGNNVVNLIPPLRCRCEELRIPMPTTEDLSSMLAKVIEREGERPSVDHKQIAQLSQRNPREALWRLECVWLGLPFQQKWCEKVKELVKHCFNVHEEIDLICSPTKITEVRRIIAELFITNIDSNHIIREISRQLMEGVSKLPRPHRLTASICAIVQRYMFRIKNATRFLLHLEGMIHEVRIAVLTYRKVTS